MSKAFTNEDTQTEEDGPEEAGPLPAHLKNYVTPRGHAALLAELATLRDGERPKVVEVVTWAAGNGDRSENADYQYGKKRLREIDRRVRYLIKQLDNAEVVDPARQQALQQVFFGATVNYAREDDGEHTVQLVGVDEADAANGKISWISPVARALLKSKVGDTVDLRTPGGVETLEVLAIRY